MNTKSATPRVWQRMLSGRRLDLLEPSPFDIEIEDIAHGLARVARWNGQTLGPHSYSVAQHSILVLEIARIWNENLSSEFCRAALLHDASEYVIGDMISPFKAVLGDGYRNVEDRLQEVIHIRFGIQPTLPPKVQKFIKQADRVSAFFEATALAGFSDKEARDFFTIPTNVSKDSISAYLEPWSTERVQKEFLQLFNQLEK